MSCCTTPTANAQLSGDPTNTRSLRQAFIRELERRFRRLRGLIRQTVGYENDALGLTGNAEARESFDFDSDAGRIEQFYRWLKQAIADEILRSVPPSAVQNGEHWTAEYIRRAYLVGWHQAAGLLFQQGWSGTALDDEDILNLPVTQGQLRQLYTRTFENLRDITRDTADTLREELTIGLERGENPRKIASRLNDEVRDIEHTRLRTLARSEIINSHSTATLDRYDDAGANVVSHGEWSTAGDDRVCRICRALEGKAFTTTEMRETSFRMDGIDFDIRLQPPAHPNGRCTILPVLGADPPADPLDVRLPDEPAPAPDANAGRVA